MGRKTGSLDLEPPPGNQRLTFCIEKGSLRSSNAGARVRCIIWWKPMTLKAGEIEVVGRDEELASVRDFLDAVDRLPAALVIEGEAGIGKTTLWRAGIAFAEELGYRVLSTRPAQAESQRRLREDSVGLLVAVRAERAGEPSVEIGRHRVELSKREPQSLSRFRQNATVTHSVALPEEGEAVDRRRRGNLSATRRPSRRFRGRTCRQEQAAPER